MGQAIGMAMRGLRPIAEIQYLDYLIYGIEPLSDDLATLRWRSDNLQQAPVIIRTRGHRLEGIWHAGSPMAMMINALRGMYILVPRNMTQAAGFYNTWSQTPKSERATWRSFPDVETRRFEPTTFDYAMTIGFKKVQAEMEKEVPRALSDHFPIKIELILEE